jgi:hypothetical protein
VSVVVVVVVSVFTKGTSAEIIEGFVAAIIELMYWLKLFKFLLELLR